MSYLMIENQGVCPVEGFTILGLSSSRYDNNAIGQFGSGNKHGILTLIRFGLIPKIYLGNKSLVFHLSKKEYQGRQWSQVSYSYDGKAFKDMTLAASYGELDWTNVNMALREFISNALDSVGGDYSQIKIKLVDEVEYKDGYTRVFIPAVPEIIRYYHNLNKFFLHFCRKENESLLTKTECNFVSIYRKGVFVRKLNSNSYFDYNFGEDFKIDESRNCDDYRCMSGAKEYWRNAPINKLRQMFCILVKRVPCWEVNFSEYGLRPYRIKNQENWLKAWKEEFGDAVIATESHLPILEKVIHKGFSVKIILSNGWYNVLQRCGVPTVIGVLDDVNDKGHEVLEPTIEMMNATKRVWNWCETINMTNGKELPSIKSFRQIMNAETERMGYYSKGIIYLNKELGVNNQTILEEIIHYITGATDNSRDFQDFCIRMSTRFAEKQGL